MQNVVLIIHLFLAIGLIGIVLLQRSEGGGLGIGGGGGGSMTGRAAATALSKATWILAVAFICTSITLTILNASATGGSSVLDRLAVPTSDGTAPTGNDLLPPAVGGDGLLPVAE